MDESTPWPARHCGVRRQPPACLTTDLITSGTKYRAAPPDTAPQPLSPSSTPRSPLWFYLPTATCRSGVIQGYPSSSITLSRSTRSIATAACIPAITIPPIFVPLVSVALFATTRFATPMPTTPPRPLHSTARWMSRSSFPRVSYSCVGTPTAERGAQTRVELPTRSVNGVNPVFGPGCHFDTCFIGKLLCYMSALGRRKCLCFYRMKKVKYQVWEWKDS